MELRILPLAITTMVGPQILVAIIFITAKKDAIKISLSYLAGILLAASTFITAIFVAARLFGLTTNAAGNPPSWAIYIEVALVILLIALSLRSYLTRKTAKQPKWMSDLQAASPGTAFKLALLLIFLMPTDIVVMLTVGLHLAAHGSNATDLLYALPFLAVVALIAGFPLYSYLLFHKRAERAMPKLRDWMQDNSWLVNIIIYLFFIYLVVT